MTIRRQLLATVVTTLLPVVSLAKGPEIFPLTEVKKGQKGYGLTVFEGTKPERFSFEVIGILEKALPKEDLILVRSDDPKIEKTGWARGMSGSPLYINDRVACAFSFAFPFSKALIGACTPIEYMLADAARPLRAPKVAGQPLSGKSALAKDWQGLEALNRMNPAKPIAPALTLSPKDNDGLQRASIPLAITGLTPGALNQARALFAPFGLEAVQGIGGSGNPKEGPGHYEMGGAIGGVLARGDVSMVGIGTVSYIDGSTVLGFGHWYFMAGELYMPAVTAEVHTIIPSYNSAFKVASPLRAIGSLVQDRQTSIVINTHKTTGMIPIKVQIESPAGRDVFNVEILRHRFLTPSLAGIVVSNATQILAPDVADATVQVESRLALRGYEPLIFADQAYSPDGAGNAIASARGLKVLAPLLFNPFGPIEIESLDVNVSIAYKADFAVIEGLRIPSQELPYGEPTYVEVGLRPYGQKSTWVRVPLTIPESLAGSTVKLEVVSGDGARPDVAPPDSLRDVVETLRKSFPSTTLVATIYTPNEGVTWAGKVVPNLPNSALDTARPATSTLRGEPYRSVTRTVIPATQVIQGRQELIVKIADHK